MKLIGRGALFRGISPSLLRAAPAAASTFVAFELTRGEWICEDAVSELTVRLYCQSRPFVDVVGSGYCQIDFESIHSTTVCSIVPRFTAFLLMKPHFCKSTDIVQQYRSS
jgi:hypothetical protein